MTPPNLALPRLYAILDVGLCASRRVEPIEVLAAWLAAGVRLVQVRAKTMPGGRMLDLVEAAVRMTHAAGGRLIVNDRADLARMAGADGVHVGQDDLPPPDVRRVLGDTGLVGLSTHNPEQVEAACRQELSYLAIGPVFETATKGPIADRPVGLEGVRHAVARAGAAGLPVVAIGGITRARAREVIGAGASSVAVISDLLAADSGARAREFLAALD